MPSSLQTFRLIRCVSSLLLIAAIVVTGTAASAQTGPGRGNREASTPVPTSTSAALDLAAIALDSTVLPEEFQLFYEATIPGTDVSEVLLGGQITQEEIDETGLLRFYQSVYSTPDGSGLIRSYVEEYETDLGAASSFTFLEDESRFTSRQADVTDEPGPGYAENPSEVTIGSDAGVTSLVDVTFRSGPIVAGVAVETMDGSAVDRDLADALGRTLFDRLEAVRGGAPLPLIDPKLPGLIPELGPEWSQIANGYQSAQEIFGAEVGPSLEVDFVSAYVVNNAWGPLAGGGFPLPRQLTSIALMSDESSALDALNQLDQLLPPFIGLEQVEIERLPGASLTIGYQFAHGYLGQTEIDSFRVILLVDTAVVTVDVLGNSDAESARVAAISIAKSQVDCLVGNGCTTPAVPRGLIVDASGTPVPNPVG